MQPSQMASCGEPAENQSCFLTYVVFHSSLAFNFAILALGAVAQRSDKGSPLDLSELVICTLAVVLNLPAGRFLLGKPNFYDHVWPLPISSGIDDLDRGLKDQGLNSDQGQRDPQRGPTSPQPVQTGAGGDQ